MSSRVLRAALVLPSLLAVSACGDSSTAPGGESEVISRVTLTLTPASGGTPITVYIDDADGNGPNAPTAQVGTFTLARGVTYTGSVKFENRLVSPAEDITVEVVAEANEHRVFYTAANTGITVSPTNNDPQGRPLGTTFSAVVAGTAVTGAGNWRVVLCHYDGAVKVATATSCAGETDIDVTFVATVSQ